jgi:hypothetical protein
MVAKGVQRVPCRKNFVRFRALVRHNGELKDCGYYLTHEKAAKAVADFREVNTKVSQGAWARENLRTTGIGYFNKRRGKILKERRHCNRCNKDLWNVSRYDWCVHHVDHNRENNVDSNFELLCKRCHQSEHCVHDNATGRYAQGSTTIPKGSTPNAGGSGGKLKL